METIISRDGARIAFWRSGHGPLLLLVHGTVADHSTTWRFVLPELERLFTVLAMDRRGRGGSSDGPVYELKREAEDIAEVVRVADEPVYVLGHSYGGLCALEASLLTDQIKKLILYEAVPLVGADYFSPGIIDQLTSLMENGDIEDMLISMLHDVVGVPLTEIEMLQSQTESWRTRLNNAPTVPRELSAFERYQFNADRFTDVQIPTMLMVGEKSPALELENATRIARSMKSAHIHVLPGQQHLAMYTAPDIFTKTVTDFLNSGC
jgi:pimeloyl-ACP methyl ester carboxylesterase